MNHPSHLLSEHPLPWGLNEEPPDSSQNALTRCTPHLFNLNSPHYTLYLTSINAFTPFIFNVYQHFHVLLPDFPSIIRSYFHLPSFIFKTTNPNISPLPSPLFGNSKQLTTIATQINLHHSFPAFWSIAIYTTILAYFSTSQYFFLTSPFWLNFQFVNN